MHDTESTNVPVEPLGFGVVRTVQAEPFHVIDIALRPVLLVDHPTAWQKVVARPGLGIGAPETDAHFGWALAIGDFDDDGWGDLVTGAPYDDHAGQVDAGGVQLLYGALFADGFERGTADGW